MKIKSLLLGCMIVSASCGKEIPSDYTVFGVGVRLTETEDGPTQPELKRATSFYFKELSKYTGKSEKKIKEMFQEIDLIHFSNDTFPYKRDGEDREANGLYRMYPLTMVSVRLLSTCIANTAYFHELTHHYVRNLLDYEDAGMNHEEEIWDWISQVKADYVSTEDMPCRDPQSL